MRGAGSELTNDPQLSPKSSVSQSALYCPQCSSFSHLYTFDSQYQLYQSPRQTSRRPSRNRPIFDMSATSTNPEPIKVAPPPWTCHYEAYVGAFYVSAKSGLPRDVAYEPLEASSAKTTEAGVWKGGMVMIQLLRYSSTPVGPYDEMILLPGNFEVPGGHGSHTRITRIYVSQRDTTFNGTHRLRVIHID